MALTGNVLTFGFPTEVHFGENSLTQLPEITKEIALSPRIYLISKGNLRNQEIVRNIQEMLSEDIYDIIIYENNATAITEEAVLKCSVVARQSRANLIMAVGGDSEINLAKMVAFHVFNPVTLENVDYYSNYEKLKTISVPTEPVAHEALIPRAFFFANNEEFISIENTCFIGDYLICDPELTATLPTNYTATTAMELLASLIELSLSVTQHELVTIFLEQGSKLLGENLANVVFDGRRIESRRNVMMASLLIGYALAQSYRGPLFALSKSLSFLSGKYTGIINTILLPHIMDFNFATFPQQFVAIARAFKENVADITMVEAAIKAVELVRRMIDTFQMPTRLSDINIKRTLIKDAVRAASRFNGLSRAQRPMERTEMVNILENAF